VIITSLQRFQNVGKDHARRAPFGCIIFYAHPQRKSPTGAKKSCRVVRMKNEKGEPTAPPFSRKFPNVTWKGYP
jgi:hypothetical protein